MISDSLVALTDALKDSLESLEFLTALKESQESLTALKDSLDSLLKDFLDSLLARLAIDGCSMTARSSSRSLRWRAATSTVAAKTAPRGES